MLEKEIKDQEANVVDVWEFLNNNKEIPLSERKVVQKAFVFVNQVRKYATPSTCEFVFNITSLGLTFNNS